VLIGSYDKTAIRMMRKVAVDVSDRTVLALNRAALESGEKMLQRVRENVTLSDHPLADFGSKTVMGDGIHPYSRKKPDPGFHAEDYPQMVHLQSHALFKSIKMRLVSSVGGQDVGAEVYVDTEIAPHATDVLFGTSKMIGRDFMTPALAQSAVEFQVRVQNYAGQALNSVRYARGGFKGSGAKMGNFGVANWSSMPKKSWR